jgi:hypothetical protein
VRHGAGRCCFNLWNGQPDPLHYQVLAVSSVEGAPQVRRAVEVAPPRAIYRSTELPHEDVEMAIDRGVALYDPVEHRPMATRFGGEDPRVAALYWRSKALWLLGYPETARVDIDQALNDAREGGHAASLLWALASSFFIVDSCCGHYTTANARVDELFALADEKDAAFWFGTGPELGSDLSGCGALT